MTKLRFDLLWISVYVFVFSLAATLVLTPLARWLGTRWGVLDHPGPRKIHQGSIPLTGGWAMFAVMTLTLWGHLLGALSIRELGWEGPFPQLVRSFVAVTPALAEKAVLVFGGAAVIFIIGLVDDIRGLSVRIRLLFQTLPAVAIVLCGIRPQLNFLPYWLGGVIGVLWIVGITNSFHLLDGLDGLATGVALVATSALLAIMTLGQQPVVGFFLLALAGTQIGFLRYNFNPARIFLGSSGSLLLGYWLAISTLLIDFGSKDNWLMPLLTPLLILAIPIYDTSSVVLIRLIQKRPLALGDQSHFHHRLLRVGFSPRETMAFICLISAAIAVGAILLVKATLFQGFLILVQVLGVMSIIVVAEHVALRARRRVLERRPSELRNRRASDLREPKATSEEVASDDSRSPSVPAK